MAFGAKVEVSSLKTRFRDLSIDIKGLKAANKNDVFKNIFDIDDIRFSVRPAPLLSAKIIINEMSIDGLKWGTQREDSGALPVKIQAKYEKQQKKENKDSLFSKLTGKIIEKGKSEITQLPALGGIKNVQEQFKNFSFDKAISIDDLESVKELDRMKQELNDKYTKYMQNINSLDTFG